MQEPLTPTLYYLLVALAAHPSGAYDLRDTIVNESHGTVTPTIRGIIIAADKAITNKWVIAASNTRPKLYSLTPAGKSALKTEAHRLSLAGTLGYQRLGEQLGRR